MLGNFSPTPYDLRFSLFGIPVRVHPLFWALAALLGIAWNPRDPGGMLIVVAVVFISILVHEMGHAITMRLFGHQPSIVMHMMGGHASYQNLDSPWASYGTSYGKSFNRRRESPWSRILITAAGPAAGFMLAGIVFAYAMVSPLDGVENEFTRRLGQFAGFMLIVNIFWSIMNLLPVLPLDGGHITEEIAKMISPYDGQRIALWISVIVGAGVALVSFIKFQEPFIGIMFAIFAFTSWQQLQGPGGFGGGGYGGGGFGGGGFGGGGGRPW